MSEMLSDSKIISIMPYIDNVSGEYEALQNEDKTQILEKAFEIMGESCKIHARDNSFYKMFFSKGYKNNFYVRSEPSMDPDYKDTGCVDGMALYFTVLDKSIKGNIFIGNINGMSKYSMFGLQKYKETDELTYYYHILDGLVISSIICSKQESFLEELNAIEKIELFEPKPQKKYKVKKRNVSN